MGEPPLFASFVKGKRLQGFALRFYGMHSML